MTASLPNFSPFPFERLRRVTRREAALESAIARWLAAAQPGAAAAGAPRKVGELGDRVARLAGGPVRIGVVGHAGARAALDPTGLRPAPRAEPAGAPPRDSLTRIDPHAALCEVRVGGASIVLTAPAAPVRALAQRLLGGPDELAAPRPLGAVEHAIWALAVAAAIEDAGIAGEVWPLAGPPPDRGGPRIELLVRLPAGPMTVTACLPPDLELQAPPPREAPAWSLAAPVVAGRCAISREAVRALAPRDVVTLERPLGGALELVIGDVRFGLRAAPGTMDAEVATGYVGRDMTLPDDAHLELTVQLGTTQLPLRRIAELAVGEVIPLGRPLAGPYEVRAAGQLVGHGELLDVDGELGVRIVSLIPGTGSRSGQE